MQIPDPSSPQATAAHRYKAAGGVVIDDRGRVLLVEREVVRNGQVVHEVRLPKGHVEPGESDEQAAVREVGEESGYCDVEPVADLGKATTRFVHRGEAIERETRYYLMRLRSDARSGHGCDPASEESLFEPRWVEGLAAAERLLTYEDEKLFARRAAEDQRSGAR